MPLSEDTRAGLRVGMRFELVDGFDQASRVGLGPWENYPERRSAALLGTWESTIDDLAVPCLPPQENGTRGEVRTTRPTPLHMNVSRYSPGELEEATHRWELPASGRTVVHLDSRTAGSVPVFRHVGVRFRLRPWPGYWPWPWPQGAAGAYPARAARRASRGSGPR